MSAWSDALTDTRQQRARDIYNRLKALPSRTKNDETIMALLGWFCLEEDCGPEELIDEDVR